MNAKKIYAQNEYHVKETGKYLVELKEVANYRTTSLCNSTMDMVSVAIDLVSYQWNLRPNRAKEFKIIKRIIINSVLNN